MILGLFLTIVCIYFILQLYSLIGFMFPEDSSPAFALFKFVQVTILLILLNYFSLGKNAIFCELKSLHFQMFLAYGLLQE